MAPKHALLQEVLGDLGPARSGSVGSDMRGRGHGWGHRSRGDLPRACTAEPAPEPLSDPRDSSTERLNFSVTVRAQSRRLRRLGLVAGCRVALRAPIPSGDRDPRALLRRRAMQDLAEGLTPGTSQERSKAFVRVPRHALLADRPHGLPADHVHAGTARGDRDDAPKRRALVATPHSCAATQANLAGLRRVKNDTTMPFRTAAAMSSLRSRRGTGSARQGWEAHALQHLGPVPIMR